MPLTCLFPPGRFATLSTLQPGILPVYEALLTPGGATLRTQPLPQALVGRTYKEARRSYDEAVVCGYIRDGKVQLLPSDLKSEVGVISRLQPYENPSS